MSELELLELFFLLAIILMLLAIIVFPIKKRALLATQSHVVIDAA